MKKFQANNKISFDLIKVAPKYSEALLYEFGSLAAASQYHRLYDLFKKYVPQKSKVLDWGTGNAHFSYWLFKNDYQAAGFGFEPKSYFGWFKDPNYEYNIGTFSDPVKISYPDSYFEAVVSVGVLEHVRDTKGDEVKSLKEVRRMLKKDGLFVCYHFPNKYSWIESIASLLPNKHHHVYRYSKGMIKDFCKKTGLDLVEVGRYGFLPRTQLGRVKGNLKTSVGLSKIWGTVDALLSILFNPICQNYYFVAKKNK